MTLSAETKFLIGTGLITIILILGGIFFFSMKNKQQSTSTQADMSILLSNTRHSQGNSNASVKIVEFADYECPACGAASPITKKVIEKNKDKVYFVFRHYPIPSHRNSKTAALASEAADEQGKFWEMHDLIFENTTDWVTSDNAKKVFEGYAEKLGLDLEKFKQDFDKGGGVINNDYTDGNKVGVDATPTFFINGEKHTGLITEDKFQDLIDKASTSK